MEAHRHPLRRWMDKHQTTLAQFGERHSIAQSTLSELINGKKCPSRDMMAKIALATDGAVMPNDFFPELPFAPAPLVTPSRRRLKKAAQAGVG